MISQIKWSNENPVVNSVWCESVCLFLKSNSHPRIAKPIQYCKLHLLTLSLKRKKCSVITEAVVY